MVFKGKPFNIQFEKKTGETASQLGVFGKKDTYICITKVINLLKITIVLLDKFIVSLIIS